jgi:hypothetical protein
MMRRRQDRRCTVETLENRRLLAVNVSYTPDGDLLIAGDTANDSIIISENDQGTEWDIAGIATPITSLVFDVNFFRPGLQVAKPSDQDVFILLDGGNDSLTMLGINQLLDPVEGEGESSGSVIFVGKTTIEMGAALDTVRLGTHPDQINVVPIPSDPDEAALVALIQFDNRANDFFGPVCVDLGGGSLLSVADDTDNQLTVVNTDYGHPGSQNIPPFTGHLEVKGAVGVDTVTILRSNNFGGSFDINTEGSDDVVMIGRDTNNPPIPLDAVTLGGNLNINTGDGADAITLALALTGGSITVTGGAGDDTIRLGSPMNTPATNRVGSSSQGNIIVNGGDGADAVTINHATTVGALQVVLGDGANTLDVRNSSFSSSSSISGGAASDVATLTAVNSPRGLHILSAGGDDTVRILGTLVELGVSSILTGPGNDTVQIGAGSRFDTLIMVTGDGNDSVAFGTNGNILGNASVEDFFLDLGAGDDHVDSGDSRFGRAFVQGGSGANTRAGQAFGQDSEEDSLFFDGFAA